MFSGYRIRVAGSVSDRMPVRRPVSGEGLVQILLELDKVCGRLIQGPMAARCQKVQTMGNDAGRSGTFIWRKQICLGRSALSQGPPDRGAQDWVRLPIPHQVRNQQSMLTRSSPGRARAF